NGFTLTKTGTNNIDLRGGGSVDAGSIVVPAGIFYIENGSGGMAISTGSAGSPLAGSITVNGGGRFAVVENYNSTNIGQAFVNRPINLVSGGVLGDLGGTFGHFRPVASAVTIYGPLDGQIDTPNAMPFILSGTITGATPGVGLLKTGVGPTILTSASNP